MAMFIGVIQVLSEPLILSFSDSKTLGIAETVCALGMLGTALVIGVTGIRKNHARVLGTALALAGLFMIVFSLYLRVRLSLFRHASPGKLQPGLSGPHQYPG